MQGLDITKFFSMKFTQTSFVIVMSFLCLCFKMIETTGAVTLVTVALGIFAKAEYEEKKLQGGNTT